MASASLNLALSASISAFAASAPAASAFAASTAASAAAFASASSFLAASTSAFAASAAAFASASSWGSTAGAASTLGSSLGASTLGPVTCRRISEMSMTLTLDPAFFAPAFRLRTQKGHAVAMTSAPTSSASLILSAAMLTAKSLNADL